MAKKRANGEGNIRKRKDGRWEGRYTAGYDEKNGKRIIKSVLGKTQAEVKEKLAKAVAEAESVDVRRADEYTLGTWLQTWYELYAKPHLRFSTAEYYRRGIELHITPRIGDIPLKKLTGRDLQWLYKELQEHGLLREAQKGKQPGLSDSTIRGIHTMLRNALDMAVKERLIDGILRDGDFSDRAFRFRTCDVGFARIVASGLLTDGNRLVFDIQVCPLERDQFTLAQAADEFQIEHRQDTSLVGS